MCQIIFVIHLKLPSSFLKFWDLGALGNCITQLPKGRAGPVCIGVVGFDYIGWNLAKWCFQNDFTI